jgi:hypothetical protein
MRNYKLGLLILLTTTLVVACATMSLERKAVNTLATIAELYDTSMKTIADLHRQGLLTDEEKLKVMDMALAVWSAYHEAQLALEMLKAIHDASSEAKLATALNALNERFSLMIETIEPLLNRARK